MKLMTVFGTRPEVIKVAPVISEIGKYPGKLTSINCVTGQHREMIEPLLKLFNIQINYDLDIMVGNQSLEHITIAVLTKMKDIIAKEKPDYLLVQGDTATAMAASLSAFYQKVKICHIEAGLRTNDKYHPYPEEVNRRIIDSVSDLLFAHTQEAKDNLLKEGIPEEKIEVTGNTVIDALMDMADRRYDARGGIFGKCVLNGEKVILVTAHRRENFGEPLVNICNAIKEVAKQYTSRVCFVYPVHLNPNVQKCVYPILGGIENVVLTAPLDYLPFVHLMKRSHFILTDSGGLQEEAPSLGKPVLVMRQTTERPEGISAGAVKVIGTNKEDIVRSIVHLLEDKNEYQRMSKAVNPYGDGKSSQRIVTRFLKEIYNGSVSK